MAQMSPMNAMHEKREAHFFAWGASIDGTTEGEGVLVVSHFEEIEAEYAAIRKGAGLMDCPQRGMIAVSGSERSDFFQRMLTNDVKPLAQGRSVRSFWLNRKGRIDADVALFEHAEKTMIDLDVMSVANTCKTWNEFLFTEDVTIEDVSERWHTLDLHGPRSREMLGQCVDDATALTDVDAPDAVCACTVDGQTVLVARDDATGEAGFALHVGVGSAIGLYERLMSAGARPAGWHAFNIARIEGGTPVFNVDFGTDSVPHETGILDRRVSFTKGCYLGQEVVARMQNLGHPAKKLVGLRISGEAIPTTGAPVIDPGAADEKNAVVGAVTSAAPSPMLSGKVIAFAMVKFALAAEGKELSVRVGDAAAGAVVSGLRFWDAAHSAH